VTTGWKNPLLSVSCQVTSVNPAPCNNFVSWVRVIAQ
jgi:hypothetical protein